MDVQTTTEPTPEDGAPRERVLPMTGGHNFRDIGGYATSDGRTVAWNRVYRSGTMAELSDADHAILAEIGLKVICDFRTTHERTNRPSRLPEMADFDIWSRDHLMSSADLIEAMRQPGATGEASRQRMIQLYRDILYEQAPSYHELFRRIARGPLPLVFHCSAGKDRTGAAAAILLEMLGVPRDVIVEDYTITDRFFARGCALIHSDPTSSRLRDVAQEIWEPMMRADAAYIEMMFETVDARHGSAEGYLRDELDLDDETIGLIRERLLV